VNAPPTDAPAPPAAPAQATPGYADLLAALEARRTAADHIRLRAMIEVREPRPA
jgi:hypothetical protein